MIFGVCVFVSKRQQRKCWGSLCGISEDGDGVIGVSEVGNLLMLLV